MRKCSYHNIIPIGDHCAISIILRELNLRQKSYPFDWVTNVESLHDTNIIYNVSLIDELNASDDVDEIVKKYIGDALDDKNKINTNSNIWFPHDTDVHTNVFEKYKRRFIRLKTDLIQPNLFVLLTRHYYIEKEVFQTIIKQLLNYNNESIILFISGTNHEYFETMNNDNVIFKHIEYDISLFYDYDYTTFRPNIKKYLSALLS
jgi:hypothetical protein